MIRGKILFISLIVMAVMAATLGLLQMWFAPFAMDVFLKTLGTIAIVGGLASFLMAVDYDFPGLSPVKKTLFTVLVILSVAGVVMVLDQIWLQTLSLSLLWKLLISDLILIGLISVILALAEDFGGNKELKDEKYID